MNRRPLIVLALFAQLAGCALTQQVTDLRRAAERKQADAGARHQAFADSLTDRNARQSAQEVATPWLAGKPQPCLLYTSPSPRDQRGSRMPSSA